MILIDDLPLLEHNEVKEYTDDKAVVLKYMLIRQQHPMWHVAVVPFEPENKFNCQKIGTNRANRVTQASDTPAG